MPKKLIADIWSGYREKYNIDGEAAVENPQQPADEVAAAPGIDAAGDEEITI
jgi:hypothetical protein